MSARTDRQRALGWVSPDWVSRERPAHAAGGEAAGAVYEERFTPERNLEMLLAIYEGQTTIDEVVRETIVEE